MTGTGTVTAAAWFLLRKLVSWTSIMDRFHCIFLLAMFAKDIWSISSDVIFIKDGSKSTPYFMSQEDSYNISTSHSFCLRHNGTLIILDTPQKFQHVTSLLRQYVTEPEKLYVDAVQKSGETYVWANGVAVNSSFWGRSNSNVNKRFAQLRFRKRSFRLITAFGIYKRYALCETDPVGDISQASVQTPSDTLTANDWSTRSAIPSTTQDVSPTTSDMFRASGSSTRLNILPTTQVVGQMISDTFSASDWPTRLDDPSTTQLLKDFQPTSTASLLTSARQIDDSLQNAITSSSDDMMSSLLRPFLMTTREETGSLLFSDLSMSEFISSTDDVVTFSLNWLEVQGTETEFRTSASKSQFGTVLTVESSSTILVSHTWPLPQEDAVSSTKKGSIITTMFDGFSNTGVLGSPSSTAPSFQPSTLSLLPSTLLLSSSSVASATSPSSTPSLPTSSPPSSTTKSSPASLQFRNSGGKCRCEVINTIKSAGSTVDIEVKVAETKAELIVNKSSLSRTMRKRSSAYDSRLSCQAAGVLSVSVLVCIGLGVVCWDLVRLVRLLERKRKTRLS